MMGQMNLTAILPELVIVVTLFIVSMFDAFTEGRKLAVGIIAVLGILTGMGTSIYLWGNKIMGFSNMIAIDEFSLILFMIVMLSGVITILVSLDYVDRFEPDGGHFYILILSAILGMMFIISATNMIVLVLGLELMSFSVYPLVGFTRDRSASLEGSMKYLLLGAYATAFLLYGIALVYSVLGTTNLYLIAKSLTARQDLMTNIIMMGGITFILIGLGFKVAVVPFHAWAPDAYEGAPAPVTGFMATAVKTASFAAIIKLVIIVFNVYKVPVSDALWVLSALTMLVGNVVAISQKNVKRMLAYSSIAHAGYIVVGLVSGSVYGMSAAIFYLIAYTFTTTGAFAIVTYLEKKDGTGNELSDYSGLSKTHPVISLMMAIFLLSLSGIPPTAGFLAKFYVFSAAISNGYIGLAIFGIFTSIISLYYYLRVVYAMYFEEPEIQTQTPVPAGISIGIIIAIWGVFQFGILPSELIHIAVQSINSLLR
ncbi:MAG: NADH-quinone oxidoreductase subunit N [Deltaproteobacteria bacterium]|nr:NADH-quinone oxidoreductase subunit N [Deltaproteobacteria bacterium]MCL5792144.1 NADH-quinone oxidoreductase subunit N [Deltaproteobacteria bacterium]